MGIFPLRNKNQERPRATYIFWQTQTVQVEFLSYGLLQEHYRRTTSKIWGDEAKPLPMGEKVHPDYALMAEASGAALRLIQLSGIAWEHQRKSDVISLGIVYFSAFPLSDRDLSDNGNAAKYTEREDKEVLDIAWFHSLVP